VGAWDSSDEAVQAKASEVIRHPASCHLGESKPKESRELWT
jgi:hypothetical protein